MSESTQDSTGRLQQTGETAKAETEATAEQAKQAAEQVTSTAAEQTKAVIGEARQQAGTVIDELRSRAVNEAEEQTRRAAGTLRQWSDDVAGLADNAPGDSPARSLVAQAADGGHRAADYLEKQNLDGVLSDLRGFARRRPGVFLGGALLAGLAVGRLAKTAGRAGQAAQSGQRGDGTAQIEAQRAPGLAAPVQDTPPVSSVPRTDPQSATSAGAPQFPSPAMAPQPSVDAPARPYPEV
jgi:hypothetical protein